MTPETLEQRFPLVGVVASESGEDYSHLIASMKRQRASDLRRVFAELEKINRDAVDLGVFERMVKDLIAELSAMLEAQS